MRISLKFGVNGKFVGIVICFYHTFSVLFIVAVKIRMFLEQSVKTK